MIHIKHIFSHILAFLKKTYFAISGKIHIFCPFWMKIDNTLRPAADTVLQLHLSKQKISSFFFAIMAFNATRAKWLSQVNEKQDYPLNIINVKSVYCKVCEKSFLASQKSQIIQHTSSDKHNKNQLHLCPH